MSSNFVNVLGQRLQSENLHEILSTMDKCCNMDTAALLDGDMAHIRDALNQKIAKFMQILDDVKTMKNEYETDQESQNKLNEEITNYSHFEEDEAFHDELAEDIRADGHWYFESLDAIRHHTRCLINGFASSSSHLSLPNDVTSTIFDFFFVDEVQPTLLLTATHYGFLRPTLEMWASNKDDLTEEGYTALHLAAKLGHEQTVSALIGMGADVNAEGEIGETPLITACDHGQHHIVRILLTERSTKINRKRKVNGASALSVACREGAVECVRQILTNDLVLVNSPKTNGRSPLFFACFFGHIEIVEMLLAHSREMQQRQLVHGQLDVNQSDSMGFTPLYVAAQNGHSRIVTLLLQNSCDVNQTVERGRTPLWVSALRGHVDVVRVLLSAPGVVIDFRDQMGVTPLWAACKNDHGEVVELLLNPPNGSGADPNAAKSDDCTPIWVAASSGSSECIRILLRYGADINQPDQWGSTPLFVASQNGHKDAVHLLVASNADGDRARTDGTTPLMMASHNGHLDVVRLLIESGASRIAECLSDPDLRGFGCAVINGHLGVVRYLFEALAKYLEGGTPKMEDFMNGGDSNHHGWTPLHLAAMGGHEDVVKYLVDEAKVDISKTDNEHKTGMQHALENQHDAIAEWLRHSMESEHGKL